ncbi:retrovirus-related pol polyprotein from transposon TNT 1-94 [Tanacetum coccineum]
MLNKDNYVPWSSRLLHYAKSDPDREVPVAKTFHEKTDDELTEKEIKQIELRGNLVTVQTNDEKNVGNHVVQNAVQNLGVWNFGNQNGLIVVLGIANHNANHNGNVRSRRRDAAYLQTQLLIAQKEESNPTPAKELLNYDAVAEELNKIGKSMQLHLDDKFAARITSGHNLFSVGQFYDSDLDVAFRKNTCFVKNLEGVDLLKGNHTTNLYTINLHEIASASLICLMAHATSTKSWLWHQRLSHLNFDTINDLAKNDLVTGLPKFKYHKEHLCPSCEQEKRKNASHPPKPVPNSKQRLHLLHMDLCGPMRVESINGKRYILVIVDDYSRYTWVHFLRSKDEAPEVIKTFLKKIQVLLQAPVIITLVEATRTMLIFSRASLFLWAEAIATACYTQNRSIIHRRFDKTPYELINGRKPDISFLYVFGALCYSKNDREDTGKLGAKGFDLTYAPSTITTQKPTEHELDLLFEAMYEDYIGGQPSAAPRTAPAAPAPQVQQTPTTSTTTAVTAPTPTNSSYQATNILNTSQDVNELRTTDHNKSTIKDNQASLQREIVVDNVPNAMFDGDVFENFIAPTLQVL